MAGERVGALRVDDRGAGGDRTHAVLHEHKGEWRPLTARESPRLLAWRAGYAEDGGTLDPAAPPLARLTAPDGRVAGWDDAGLGETLGEDLGRPVRLRRDLAGIQDLGRSLLITVEATLIALGAELGTELDLRRFRPNVHLVLDGEPWAEHGWEGGRLEFAGGVVADLLHPCEPRPRHPAQVAAAAAPPRARARDAVRDQRARDDAGADRRRRGRPARALTLEERGARADTGLTPAPHWRTELCCASTRRPTP